MKPKELSKVLKSTTRIRILLYLSEKKSSHVREIARYLDLTPQTVGEHLKILHSEGLISFEEKGPLKIYRLNENERTNLLLQFIKEICEI